MKQDWIGVLDCNNFFVSCERLFRPDLRQKPVVVLSSNDGCIVARSQEIKDNHIPMGVPYFKVKDKLLSLKTTCFSSNFTLYRDLSRRVFEVMRSELGEIEEYSIDEAFFSFSNLSEEEVVTEVHQLKDKVEKLVGIPVSIGLGPSKTIAKYANDRAKKTTGVVAIDTKTFSSLAATIQLGSIWGVGYKTTRLFRDYELTTVADYLAVDSSRCQTLFGMVGMRLRSELSEAQRLSDLTNTSKKTIISSRSFRAPSTNIAVIKDALSYHVTEIASELRGIHQKAGFIRIFILPNRHGDFVLQGASAEAILEVPQHDSLALLKVAHKLFASIYRAEVPYHKVGVAVGSFVPETVEQISLFADTNSTKIEGLMSAIDTLNQQFGHETVKLGSSLRGREWKAKSESRSPAYTTNWTDLQNVRA